jgi:hypothetical protein
VEHSERRRQIEEDLDPTGMIRRLAWDGSGWFTVEEWNAYVGLSQTTPEGITQAPDVLCHRGQWLANTLGDFQRHRQIAHHPHVVVRAIDGLVK